MSWGSNDFVIESSGGCFRYEYGIWMKALGEKRRQGEISVRIGTLDRWEACTSCFKICKVDLVEAKHFFK